MMLRDYQQRAVDHILSHKSSALWLDCGLGKTLTTLTALDQLPLPALVIAPKRVITHSWPAEIAQWRPWLSVINLADKPLRREYLMRQRADIYLINYELLPWLAGYDWRWPTVIVDESSRVKSHRCQAFKVLKKAPYQRMVQLTGTPIPNGLEDLWSQMFLLDKGERLGKTLTAFRERWFRQSYMGWGWEERPHAVAEVKERCADIAISMSADDYLTLPDKMIVDVPVELPTAAAKAYKAMLKSMVAEIAGQEITALSAATKAGKLLQIASGQVYNEDGEPVALHTAKLDALDDIINGNTIIVYQYRSELAALRAKYPSAVDVKEPDAIDQWNAGELPIMTLQPACLHPETEVLTEYRGWVKIVTVGNNDRVFDGVEFVSHSGCMFSGVNETVEVFGIRMTPEHRLLINNEWVEAKNVQYIRDAKRKALYAKRCPTDSSASGVLNLWWRVDSGKAECFTEQQVKPTALQRLHRDNIPPHDKHTLLGDMERYGRSCDKTKGQKLSTVWCKRDWFRREMARLQEFLCRYVRYIRGQLDDRPHRQRERLFQDELSLGHNLRAAAQQKEQSYSDIQRGCYNAITAMRENTHRQRADNAVPEQRDDGGRSRSSSESIELWEGSPRKKGPVYDLVNCGPRNRFLIRNQSGEVFVSHNSGGHGLNLQHGGHNMIWLTPTYNLEHYQQTCARLHRSGQEHPVMIYRIIADGTIDSKVIDIIEGKGDIQSALLSAVK